MRNHLALLALVLCGLCASEQAFATLPSGEASGSSRFTQALRSCHVPTSTLQKVGSSRKRYTGRRITIFFYKAEIHNLLRLFAEISGLNFVASGKVKGRVTLRLRNVRWDLALDVTLRSLGLSMERHGNVVRIATTQELLQQARPKPRPMAMRVVLIRVNYAKATKMAQLVKMVLSPKGKVSVDNRTNTLIIKDYSHYIDRAKRFIGAR